jgi:plasmid stabilization system protein ParE
MTVPRLALAFAPKAKQDIDEEVDYLREHAGKVVADGYIRSVNHTTSLLLSTPHMGLGCDFKSIRYRKVRRLPVHAPFQKRLLFYTPSDSELRVERVLHSARNWAVLFRPIRNPRPSIRQ